MQLAGGDVVQLRLFMYFIHDDTIYTRCIILYVLHVLRLSASLTPKLGDCGLSRFLPQDRPGQQRMTMQMTRGAAAAGTPGFMCRKYVSTGEFNPKSEVYSIGVTCAAMASSFSRFWNAILLLSTALGVSACVR